MAAIQGNKATAPAVKTIPPKGAPAAKAVPAPKVKGKPKMSQIIHEDGRHEFAFSGAGPIPSQFYSLSDFPQAVRDFFASFGMKTKLRNFTVPDADEHESTAEAMAVKLAKGAALLKQGILRIAREPGEKKAGGTKMLEIAMVYKRMKAAAKGKEQTQTELDVAKELEALSEADLATLKETTFWGLAKIEVEEVRAAAKKKALLAQAAAEAAEEEKATA